MAGNAPRIVLWLGSLMVLLGMISRYIIGVRGVSGFVPLIFGMPIAALGFMAMDPNYYRSSMRAVTGLAVLGLLLTFHVVPLLQALLRGEQTSESMATILIGSTTLLLSTILLLICIVVFVNAWWKRMRAGRREQPR